MHWYDEDESAVWSDACASTMTPVEFGAFVGNVYDDKGKLTGQVLVTGNPDGDDPAAHTVLLVGGVKYDAVLGTKGAAVDASVDDEFGPFVKKKKVDQTGDTKVSQSTKGT